MRRILSLALVPVMVLGCISLSACAGGNGGEVPAPPAEEEPAPPSSDEEASPPPSSSGGDVSWGDMPVYSGAKEIQKGSWATPPAGGDYSRVEWRYYEADADVSAVATFYKSAMPGEGWQEATWVEVPDGRWGMYNKNNEQDAAMIWVARKEGNTVIALMRASE